MTTATSYAVRDSARLNFLPNLVGRYYNRFQDACFNMMQEADSDYTGGMWNFASLTRAGNGLRGGYIYPSTDRTINMVSMNGWFGPMSAEAAGICISLTVLSHLSFAAHEAGNANDCERISDHFHALREWSYDHPEAAAIVAFCD